MNFKFYCTVGADGHGNWMEPVGGVETSNIEESDVLVLGGGADVDPATYGEEPSKRTYSNPSREAAEIADFKTAQKLGIKTVGICRGHQLLCALAGGKLIQDVTNHTGTHSMTTFDEQEMNTNSLHHQMIHPYNLPDNKYKVLAWSTRRMSNYYIGASNKRMFMPLQFQEIEAIVFPDIKGLGFQYHPEMLFHNNSRIPAVYWTQQTLLKFLNGTL